LTDTVYHQSWAKSTASFSRQFAVTDVETNQTFPLFHQAPWKKYDSYSLETDPDQDDKAKEIKLCNFARPHMRAFHCSWWGFFIAFFIWFAIAPLLSEIKETLGLTKQQIWTSNIVAVGSTIMMRFILGPMCDKVRNLMCAIVMSLLQILALLTNE
jgi:NNP family nitrate/nitrite transporter-like MFS transporter